MHCNRAHVSNAIAYYITAGQSQGCEGRQPIPLKVRRNSPFEKFLLYFLFIFENTLFFLPFVCHLSIENRFGSSLGLLMEDLYFD